jgi:uncharacterized membrane protein YphA (DoxX/SURF4 family)
MPNLKLTVNECCFCIELKTGCLIIGYLTAIVNAIYALITIAALVITYAFLKEEDVEVPTTGEIFLNIFFIILFKFFKNIFIFLDAFLNFLNLIFNFFNFIF